MSGNRLSAKIWLIISRCYSFLVGLRQEKYDTPEFLSEDFESRVILSSLVALLGTKAREILTGYVQLIYQRSTNIEFEIKGYVVGDDFCFYYEWSIDDREDGLISSATIAIKIAIVGPPELLKLGLIVTGVDPTTQEQEYFTKAEVILSEVLENIGWVRVTNPLHLLNSKVFCDDEEYQIPLPYTFYRSDQI